MALNKDATATDYCINFTEDEFTVILDKDKLAQYKDTLGERLDRIDGVDRAEYDGHFGAHVFVRVETDYDTSETWDAIEVEIIA